MFGFREHEDGSNKFAFRGLYVGDPNGSDREEEVPHKDYHLLGYVRFMSCYVP